MRGRVDAAVVSGQWALRWCNEAWPPTVAHPAMAPVCRSPFSQWTCNQLDSSAIFEAINAIWFERKSIRRVHLCLRVKKKIYCGGRSARLKDRFHKIVCDVS